MTGFAFVRDPPERLGDLAAALGMSQWVIRVPLGRWRVEATVDGDVVRSIGLY